jgi:uracil-DNA glycosylase family 4
MKGNASYKFPGMRITRPLNQEEKTEALEILNYQIRSCEGCNLSATRKNALTGEGNINARIMFVALSPGIQENLHNQMFIGPSGQVLNKLLYSAGIRRDSIFMTNLIKCMLPKNRKPNRNEIESCHQFMEEEILIIQPEVIVPLGYYAARTLLQKYHEDHEEQSTHGNKSVFGQIINLGSHKIYPVPHPASLLYNPSYESDTIEKYRRITTL